MKYSIGQMSNGEILSRGFSLLFSRLGTFYGIMLIVQLPVLALELALPDFMVSGFGGLAFLLPGFILQMIGTGALIRVVMQEYLDRPVTFGEAFQFALSRFGPLLGTSLLSGLFIALGLLACFAPAIYLSIIFCMSSQVVIVEDLAGMSALSRSKTLVTDQFGRVFGLLFLVGICAAILGGGVSFLAIQMLPYQQIVNPTNPFGAVRVSNYGNYAICMVVNTLVQTFVGTYVAICTTLLYFDLRNRKESFGMELLADKIDSWTTHFQSRPYEKSQDVQQRDVAVQSPHADAERPETNIRPASPPDVPPTGSEPPR
jgi:hypothetical protein